MLGLLNNLIDNGKDISVFILSLIEHFRNLMIAKVTGGDAKLIDLPIEICERLVRQSEALSLEEIFSIFNILVNTHEMSKRLDSLRIPLEISLVRLAYDKKASYSQDLKHSSIKELPQEAKTPLEKTKKDESLMDSNDPPSLISLDNIKEGWQNIINNLEKIKMSVATYLSEGEPLKLQRNILTVSFPKNYSLHRETLEKKDNKTIIEKTMSELFNTNLRVNFILSQEFKQREDNGNNTFIKSALDMFDGRVVKEE